MPPCALGGNIQRPILAFFALKMRDILTHEGGGELRVVFAQGGSCQTKKVCRHLLKSWNEPRK